MAEATEKQPRKSKRQRFLDVAVPRTQKIIRGVRLLGKCSNEASYSYTEKDVERIFGAIEKELERARLGFARNKDDVKFTLDDQDAEGGEEADSTD